MEVYTIGFTKRTAADFFETLRAAGVRRLLDVRLRNTSQLAGWAKRDDLRFFLRELCGADYVHEPLLAPTDELLDGYRKVGARARAEAWERYAPAFLALMAARDVQTRLDPALFAGPTALLCSEALADRCHRRLVLEYLGGSGHQEWAGLAAVHL